MMQTRPLLGNFGAEITGIDVRTAPRETLEAISETLALSGAVVIRDQDLTPQDQVAFTSAFGEPAPGGLPKFTVPGVPEVFVISNKIVDGKPIGDPEPGGAWHTDLNYAQRPAAYTFLHAREVPSEGSDTLLADTCAAFNALAEERQQELDPLVVHHSYANLQARQNRELSEQEKIEFPDVFHPLIRRHPADGRRTLWGLSTRTPKGIVGMETQKGLDLIKELMQFAVQERFVYRHKWRVGDVLVWDNRCTMHTGTPFDKERHVRLVYRTWVRGEVPIGAH